MSGMGVGVDEWGVEGRDGGRLLGGRVGGRVGLEMLG